MTFEDAFLSREHRYSLGVELTSGLYYAAIPVSNQMVDYVERYELSDEEYHGFLHDPDSALKFIESCRNRAEDRRLFLQPGSDRGTPR